MTTTPRSLPDMTTSPFGGDATLVQELSPEVIAHKYRKKCNIEVLPFFGHTQRIGLYECALTGYRFWRPECVAGTEEFYHLVSNAWENYYKTKRWEYSITRKHVHNKMNVLEVGCGRGYFLRSLEKTGADCEGLELNSQAIANKVTRHPVHSGTIESFANANAGKFDVVCSFQVLEHVVDPHSFLKAAATCLGPGGYLVVSTPNREYRPHMEQEDAFDLPPHHMGHFSAETYRRIAPLIGMANCQVQLEARSYTTRSVSATTNGRLVFKLGRFATKMIMNSTFRLVREPGPGIVALYQKQA